MKKVITLVCAIVLLLAAVPMGAVSAATTGTYNGITYQIESGQVTLTGYTSALPITLVIPETIAGYPVTTIGYTAFKNSSVTSVTIPDSVTYIDNYAFAWCDKLKTAVVGNGVTTINYGAFSYNRLTTISIGRGATDISPDAFMSCRQLTAVHVDDANPSYCSKNGVLYNKAMTHLIYYPGGKPGSYTVPEGVTTIYGGAFDFCDTITSISLPSTLKSIPEQGFADCRNFSAIYIAEDNPYMSSIDGVVFSKDKKALSFCPSGKSGVYVIPDGVTDIRSSAFHHCQKLSAIIIPDTVTSIGESAFGYCHGLTHITIPDSVTYIGDYLFYDCNNLTTAYVGDGITRLSWMAFFDCHNLKSIRLPDRLTYIGYAALWNTAYYNNDANWTGDLLYLDSYLVGAMDALSGECIVREGTTLIGEYTFHDCTALTSIIIPEGVRAIEFSTFGGCKALKTITLPRSLTFVGEWAFSACSKLKDVYYGGTASDRAAITIEIRNNPLTNATWHYTVATIPGDADGNGKTNNRDLGLLQQYLNEWTVTIDTKAVDMDGNGRINNRDLGLLQRHLNN